MQTLVQNLRFALRQLRRSPGFALTVILTLALGIGTNTAVFSLLDQALLRSLPVRNPQQLVVLEGTGDAWQGSTSSFGGDTAAYFSYPMYRDLQSESKTHGLQGFIAMSKIDVALTFHGDSQIASGEIVSGNYFDLLGTPAYRGRLLSPSDDTSPGANPVAVLSYSFWQNHLAGNANVIGQAVSINGYPFQIVGIASPGFHSAIWGETPALFFPMSMLGIISPHEGVMLTEHKDRWLNIVGRLSPGVTRDQAQAALAPLWHALRADELKALGSQSPHFVKDFLTNSRLLVLPGARGFSYQRSSFQTPLLVVMAMALLVLLIASVNVGSLLLVRSAGREREFSLRAALGAGQSKLIVQLLIEGLLIGLFGGVTGLLLAPIALRVLVHRLTGLDNTSAFSSSLDLRALAFNFVVALLVSLAFSLTPALNLRRSRLMNALRGSKSSSSGSVLGLRRAIVCLQIGLSVVLLIASGLFVRTMHNLRALNIGFNPQHLISFSVSPALAGYTSVRIIQLAQNSASELSALPGVQCVAATDQPELTGDSHGGNISLAGYTPPPDEEVDVQKTYINPQFLPCMQIPILAGRNITAADAATGSRVAIINESLAKRYYGSPANALGKTLMDGASNKPVYDTQIVGVVPDFKESGIRDAVDPSLFRPIPQYAEKRGIQQLYFYLRTPLPPAQTITAIRHTMKQLDSALPLDDLHSMDAQIDEDLSNERLIELLAISFGVLATLLAGIGLYGVLAYSTAQRTREIGVRIALGSSRLAISRIVLADVLRLAAIGVAVAIPVTLGLSRFLTSQLFGVSPTDPLTIASVILLISAVVILAALIPATRAATVNPTEALRSE
ncbi:MAG: ABC transporter permease [Acidobacteriaceae bacterium]